MHLFDKVDLSGRLTDEEYNTRITAAQRTVPSMGDSGAQVTAA